MTKKIMGMGNAVLDILANAKDSDLEKNKLIKGTMALVDQKESDSLLNEINFVKKDAGGSVANSLAAISHFGGNAFFCGKVKDDDLGNEFISSMENVGTKFLCKKSTDGLPTARCIVMVTPDGERTMQTFLGASTTLSVEDIDYSFFEEIDYILVEGYLWSSPTAREAIQKSIGIAKKNKIKIVFSLSDAGLVNMFRTDFEEFITDNVDILIGNENEFKELNKSSTNKFDLDNIDKIVEVGVVTMGEKGAIILNNQQKIAIEAEKVDKVIDSTGAGDMFAAGFLFELLNGKSLETSGKFGCKVASKIVTQYGARPPKDFLNDIK